MPPPNDRRAHPGGGHLVDRDVEGQRQRFAAAADDDAARFGAAIRDWFPRW